MKITIAAALLFVAIAVPGCHKDAAQPTPAPVPSATLEPPVAVAPPDDAGNPGGYVRAARVEVPPLPPMPDVSQIAGERTDKGLPVLKRVPNMALAFDPNLVDPITGLGTCSELITNCTTSTKCSKLAPDCVVPVKQRSLDACVISVPICATATPWIEAEKTPCCPQSCVDAYEANRRKGDADGEAFEHTLYGNTSCYPGVDKTLGHSK